MAALQQYVIVPSVIISTNLSLLNAQKHETPDFISVFSFALANLVFLRIIRLCDEVEGG